MHTIENSFASLPDEASAVVWRIFGEGESPLTPKTAFESIVPTAHKHVSSENRDRIIAEFSSWFQQKDGQDRLQEDLRTCVDEAILDGVRDALSEGLTGGDEISALWAVGYVGSEIAEPIIRRCWSDAETFKFAGHVVSALKSLHQRQALIDSARVMRVDVGDATAEPRLVQRERRLFAYRDLRHSGIWLYDGVQNVVELLVNLEAVRLTEMSQIGNPVLQTHVAELRMRRSDSDGPGNALRWIAEDASDATIALAIVETIDRVNELDSDLLRGIEPVPEKSKIEAAVASLLEHLVDQLASMGPAVSPGWICDLLEYVATAFYTFGNKEKPRRLTQLEELCAPSLSRLLTEHWSQQLLNEFEDGLSSAPYTPRILPFAEAALKIRNIHPAKAHEIARMIIASLEQRVDATVSGEDGLFYRLAEWRDREWILGLGIALAISDEELDLEQWVADRCSRLGLSAWDAEEDFGKFLASDRIVQLRFLVAYDAVATRSEIGAAVSPETVRSLTEKLWSHCGFVGTFSFDSPENSDAAEFAARAAVLFGEPSDDWILDCTAQHHVGSRALWAILDQSSKNTKGVVRGKEERDDAVAKAILSVASERLGDPSRFSLETLYWVGKLWRALGAADEAGRTARAILALRHPKMNRAYTILALELLIFAAGGSKGDQRAKIDSEALYTELWPTAYTPVEELSNRRAIDEVLEGAKG